MIDLGTVCFGECMCGKRRQNIVHVRTVMIMMRLSPQSRACRQGAVICILAILLDSGRSEAEVAIVAVWDHAGMPFSLMVMTYGSSRLKTSSSGSLGLAWMDGLGRRLAAGAIAMISARGERVRRSCDPDVCSANCGCLWRWSCLLCWL